MDSHTTTRYFTAYAPPGVEFLTTGGSCYVGCIDRTTVLKYPRTAGDEETLDLLKTEARIYQAIGSHKHIIGYKGQREDGIMLERAQYSVSEYLKHNQPGLPQRLIWVRQATEAVAAVHAGNVIHRDINLNNLLLDRSFDIKLCDFQGHLLGSDGSIEAQGNALENTKSYMPREHHSTANQQTDLFALGSAFYYILEGHEPFPELDSFDDEDEIERRFASHEFPELNLSSMRQIVHNCWAAKYNSATEILQDLEAVGIPNLQESQSVIGSPFASISIEDNQARLSDVPSVRVEPERAFT
ncbi:hypothetical protein MMC25_003446 [Agyrium rufum]|nr:hypothetical protein [Agyrium rufum]